MAAVEIAVDDFSKSEVPPVCIFSGAPSDNVFRFKFGGVTGGLPVNDDMLASLGRLRKVILALAAASILCFAFGLASGSGLAALMALGFMLVAVGTTISARRKLVRGTVVGDRLLLNGVHPAFVSAVNGGPIGKCATCTTFADCPSRNYETPSDCTNAR